MALVALPPLTPKWLVITLVQLFITLASYGGERLDPTPYSKFASASKKMGRMVPSRVGMLITYSPALLVASLQSLTPDMDINATCVATMLVVHFLKRCLEVLLLHRYSGEMPLALACMLGAFYSIITLVVNAAERTEPCNASRVAEPPNYLELGAVIFCVGQAGNFYHHWLLATLRKDGAKGYVVPQGGLFPLVNSPHYFFELVAWYGLAIAAGQLNVFLVATGMTSLLAGRSAGTSNWYKLNVKDFPGSRGHMVPFVF